MSGSSIAQIKMRPVWLVLVFTSVWLAPTGLVCIGIGMAGLMNMEEVFQKGFEPITLFPFFMFLFGYGLLLLDTGWILKRPNVFY